MRRRWAGGNARRSRDLSSMTDTELLAAVPYEQWAFPEFYRRHFFDVAGWMFRRTHDAGTAHALANEAMALAFQWAVKPNRAEVEFPKAWVFTIARHELARWRKRGMVETPASDDVGLAMPVADSRLEAIVEYSDLYAALDELSDDEALALVMGYGGGHTTEEVAEMIGRSREATKKMMQRAKSRVRDRLEMGEGG